MLGGVDALSDLVLADDCLWAGVLYPDFLPEVATDLLVRGLDTPALRELAGLDLEPFDPREARDLWETVTREVGVPDRDRGARVVSAAQALAASASTRSLPTDVVLRRFFCLTLAGDYPDDSDLMRLYGLDDEYRDDWGRSRAEIEIEVKGLLARLSARAQPPSPVLIEAVANSQI